jgi:phage shock protein PspC (stress-responsive transcriptional regulator)
MKKKLYRNPDDVMLTGTLSGMSDYFGADPVIWRLAFIALLIVTGGAMAFLYLAAWFMVPHRPKITPVDAADYTVQKD